MVDLDDIVAPFPSEPSVVYEWLDHWSDGELRAFATRLRGAPNKHVYATIDAWPDILPRLHAVPIGELRPMLGNVAGHERMVGAGARMLLYTKQVVISHSLLMVEHLRAAHASAVKDELAEQIELLALLRPLVEDGSVHFTTTKDLAIGRHPSRLLGHFDMMERVDETQWDPFEFGTAEPFTRKNYAGILGATVVAVERGKGTPLALTRNEELAFEAAFGGRSLDARPVGLRKLAALTLPDYTASIESLIHLRTSSEALGDFRAAMTTAMAAVAEIPQDDDAAHETEGIFADVLSTELARVEKEARKSVLKKIVAPLGVKRLAFAGIGFLAGAGAASLTGAAPLAPAAGAAGSIAMSGIDISHEAIKAAKSRRESRAVWDVVMSFRSAPAPERE